MALYVDKNLLYYNLLPNKTGEDLLSYYYSGPYAGHLVLNLGSSPPKHMCANQNVPSSMCGSDYSKWHDMTIRPIRYYYNLLHAYEKHLEECA